MFCQCFAVCFAKLKNYAMITTSIIFDYRKRAGKDKNGNVDVRVIVDRHSYYISTGVHVRAREWECGAVVNRSDCDVLNERVRIIKRKVDDAINDAIAKGVAVDVAEIRRKVVNVRNDREIDAFINWMDESVEMLNIAEGTKKHYRLMVKRVGEFERIRQWSDVTVENIMAFDSWCHSLKKELTEAQKTRGEEVEPLSDSAIYTYHKCMKKMLNYAVKIGRVDRNPYDRLKGEFSRGERECVDYLTSEEIDRIREAKFANSFMQTIRDLFVLQLFTGMAYSDMQKFDIRNYHYDNGKWVANEERVKTGVAFVGHLLSPVVEVLERYQWRVPQMTNQVYNRGLKEMAQMLGINAKLHTHLARHSFATYMLSNGVKIENLQRMLGHKDIAMTQRYAKTLAQSVHDEFDMIEAKIKKESR